MSVDFEGLFDALREGGVNFVIVGGTAAVLHGAPLTTEDVDIVHERTPENVDRLLAVLATLDGRIRDLSGRVILPNAAILSGRGQVQMTTRLGPIDVLCELHDGRGYNELLAHSVAFGDAGLDVRVLDLETLIAVKRAAGRAKDRLALPVLIALQKKIGT